MTVKPSAAAHEWSPSSHAINFETFGSHDDVRRTTKVVSHPTAPFARALGADETLSEDLLIRTAHAYLVQLDATLSDQGRGEIGLSSGWLEALNPSNNTARTSYFGWLSVTPSFGEKLESSPSATASRRLLRATAGIGSSNDETIILVAGERLRDSSGAWRSTGSGFGLRIVLHLRPRNGDSVLVATGLTAHLSNSPYILLSDLLMDKAVSSGFKSMFDKGASELILRTTQRAAREVAKAAQLWLSDGLQTNELRFIKVKDPKGGESKVRIELSGVGVSSVQGDRETAYRVRARVNLAEPYNVEILSRRALVAQARARVFEHEPASCPDTAPAFSKENLWHATRPTRDIAPFRSATNVPQVLESSIGDFVVRNCPSFVPADPKVPGGRLVTDEPAGHPVRSNDQSAVNAYWVCHDVFATMRGLGLDPARYFRACQRPLNVFYRSGVRPGPGKSGRAINAWVRMSKAGGASTDTRPSIEMHLAAANLSRRWRNPELPAEQRWAEPLGIGTSDRWILHEFGHVLIGAVLGDPEFLFAHSPGDGLAAIWADPVSRLSDPLWSASERFRGYTFPWVFSARRHDRCVLNGWSWGGTFQRPVSDAPEVELENYKGYVSEQILSTTLFRLYRCIGGDALKNDGRTRDVERRQAASRVVFYLLLRAIESFGHNPLRAEELEVAMIEADVGLTSPLRDPDAPSTQIWIGGQAHKVIRWAFEAQGMHAPDPHVLHDAPGLPPPVDIYVSDRRTPHEATERGFVQYGPGNYTPVSLDWSNDAKWFHAGQDAAPEIGNRGRKPATGILMRMWTGLLTGDQQQDGWDSKSNITWQDQTEKQITDLPGNATRPLGDVTPPLPATGGEMIVLIELSCPDDRANTDPLTWLPTSVASVADLPTTPRDLATLVAVDNNLVLWRPFVESLVA
jgi:hypothetical protein